MKQLLAVLGLGLVVLAAGSSMGTFEHVSPKTADNQVMAVTSAAPASSAEQDGEAGSAVVLHRAADGHFYADAMVNGAPVRFMVDTGASTVALTEADAEALGIDTNANDFNEVGQGVGGAVPLKGVQLGSLAVGAIEKQNVRAVVVNSDLQVSLLGQSWLSQVGNVNIQNDVMTLSDAKGG